MQPDESFFTSDGIDAQIDHPLGVSSDTTPEVRLMHDLQAQFFTERDASATLARAWVRIQAQTKTRAEQRVPMTPHRGGSITTQPHHTSLPPPRPVAARDTRPEPRRRPWVGALAALLVVVLGAAVFALRSGTQPKGNGGIAATATPFAPKMWVHITQLDYDAPGTTTVPAIAPSNPDVIYALYLGADKVTPLLHRTDDGGKTWHELALPVPGSPAKNSFRSFVSPLDPKTIFLLVFETDKQYCPPDRQHDSTVQGIVCFLQYLSTDAGIHWQLQQLPLSGTFVPSILGNEQNLRAQGKRLYMTLTCNDFAYCTRIITSTDGGKTWTLADATVNASSHDLCDFSVTPTGSTIIAFAGATCLPNAQPTPIHLWQSDDTGTTWRDNGPVSAPIIQGTALAAGADATHPLLYADIPTITSTTRDKTGQPLYTYSAAPGDVKVKADGGKTWLPAPTLGFPANRVVVQVSAALPNGAVLVETAPVGNPVDSSGIAQGIMYLTWKAGDASWHQFGDTLDVSPEYVIVTTPGAPQWHVWLAGVRAPPFFAMQIFKI